MRALAIVWDAPLGPGAGEYHMQCARIAEACFHLGTTAALYEPGLDGSPSTSTKAADKRAGKRADKRADNGREAREGAPLSAVCLDVTGCACLFGKTTEEGERAILAEAQERVTSLLSAEEPGHPVRVRVAIADGPRVALAIAAFGGGGAASGGGSRVLVPHGEARLAMARLPLAALPLPLAARTWLSRLGISRVAELLALPRKELGSRLGAAEKDVFSLALGDDRAPLVPYVPPSTPAETVDLDLGLDSHEALAFVLKTLAARMSGRLSGRGVAVAKMEVVLSLDVASLTGKKGERARAEGRRREEHTEEVVLPAPLASERDLFTVLRAKMERVTLAAPVRGVTLRVTELSASPARALSLFSALPKAEGALARLAGELSVEGCQVGELGLADTWDPAARSALVPLGTRARDLAKKASAQGDGPSPFEGAPEPTLLLAERRAIARRDLTAVRFLSRVAELHWWRGARASGGRAGFDRVMGKVGERLACVEILRATGEAAITGYFD